MRSFRTWPIVCALFAVPVAAAAAAPEVKVLETPRASLEAFIADAKAKKIDAVRARIFVPDGEAAKRETDELIEAAAGGTFEAFEIRILDAKVSEAGGAAAVAAEFRAAGRRADVDPMYLLRDAGKWKVLPSPDLERFPTLSGEHKKQLGEVKTWFEVRKAELVRAKADDDAGSEAQRKLNTGLALAAIKGDAAAVERFLRDGADVNGEAAFLGSPLKAVVERDNVEMIRLLVRHGADINRHGDSLLMTAIERGKPETVRALVDLGADVNRRHHSDTPLGVAVAQGKSDLVKLLLDAKADPKPQFPVGGPIRRTNLLNLAAASGDMKAFELIRPHFPDLKIADENGQTALHAMAEPAFPTHGKDHAAIVAALLKAGADPHAKLPEKSASIRWGAEVNTPLRLAARTYAPQVLEALLGQVKYEPAELSHALRLGARYFAEPSSIQKLIEAGADPNAPSPATGRTALHDATANASPEVVAVLLERGGNPTLKDGKGQDCLTLARLRVVKGRESVTDEGRYIGELPKTPDAGAKVLALLQKRPRTAK